MENLEHSVIRPYGLWESPLSIESIFNQPSTPQYPFRHQGKLFWIQSLPEQQGRTGLMTLKGDQVTCLTPAEFNIRSGVHEYGGQCFCHCHNYIVFNNFADGCLYRQELSIGSVPSPVTGRDQSILGFADLVFLPNSQQVIAVVEQAVEEESHKNAIVAVNPEQSEAVPIVLISGSDFYAAPVVNPNNSRLAWFEWDQEYMPWDQSRLCITSLSIASSQMSCGETRTLVAETNRSICQPGFVDDDTLVFVSDSEINNWWNLFALNVSSSHTSPRQITNESLEFGEAHWVFGQRRWVQSESNEILAIATDHTGDGIWKIDIEGKREPRVFYRQAGLCHLNWSCEHCQLVELPENTPGQIVEFDRGLNRSVPENSLTVDPVSTEWSKPLPLDCKTSDGESTFGYFYPPASGKYCAPENTLPPLIVMVHGGPTSRASTAFNPLKQYFSALGFAVLDINHRGSTGYGRRYRQKLLGNWGEIDAQDINDFIGSLIARNLVNQDAVFIRGGSAGGYAVLRVLTRYPGRFAAGACYYGIGNLITLSEITHKFEGKYTDRLIGEKYHPTTASRPESRYFKRSPIFHMEKLTAPLILFQGSEDKVVPPMVSQEVVKLLENKGIRHGYTEYQGEGHGFRKTETRIDSLQKETDFFVETIQDSAR